MLVYALYIYIVCSIYIYIHTNTTYIHIHIHTKDIYSIIGINDIINAVVFMNLVYSRKDFIQTRIRKTEGAVSSITFYSVLSLNYAKRSELVVLITKINEVLRLRVHGVK